MTDEWRSDEEANALVRAIHAAEDMEPWQPMRRVQINPEAVLASQAVGDTAPQEAWANDTYDCQIRYLDPERGRAGALHLSIKRLDRQAVRDWRQLQAIKNDVCGWEREGIELFPAESRLVDGANQTHLWVTPAGMTLEVGFRERAVATEEEMREKLTTLGIDPAKGRQRPWQPGITTGPNYKPGGR